ncbi:MAG: DUF433 domain-containing protein [Acidobacteria bacterium]|nr:DUF433 domain-containing protein [Acidobacteriota bacterium]
MNAVDSIRETEFAIAGLSKTAKRQLLKRLSRSFADEPSSVEKNSKVMGGVACIRGTRIPVWLLEQARSQGVTEAELLQNYPGLTAEDLVNAWDYVRMNEDEVRTAIENNERKN